MTIQEIENPSDKYPKPPFERQSQPWPGLASKMDPKPDHGETSYRARTACRRKADHRRRFGHGSRRCHRLRARRRRRGDQLLSHRGAGRAEVIALIKARRTHRSRDSGRPAGRGVLHEARGRGGERPGRPRHRRQQRRPPADPCLHPRYLHRAVRLDDEDEHLRAILDHQGGAAASKAGLGDHRHDVRAGLRSRRRNSTTTRRPRRRR